MINGFHHIGLKVTDIEKSEEFYKDAFGLFPYRAWGEGDGKVVMLKAPGGMILELFAGGCDSLRVKSVWQHIALATDDTDAAFEKAVSSGAEVKVAPFSTVIKSTPAETPVRIAFVYGPDREEIELFRDMTGIKA